MFFEIPGVVCLDLGRERFAGRKSNTSEEPLPAKMMRIKLTGTLTLKYVPGQLDAITERLFRENVADVILDRSYAQAQCSSNLLVAEAARDTARDPFFGVSQLIIFEQVHTQFCLTRCYFF